MTDSKGKPITRYLKNLMKRSEFGTVVAAVALFLFFSLVTDSFFTPYNLFNLGRNLSVNIFIALGQAVVMIVGGMNLSLGAIGGLATITTGMMMENFGLPSWIAVLGAFAVGMFAGWLNGIVITRTRLNSFIVTLATSFIFTGLVNGISKGYPFTKIPENFTLLGQGGVGGVPYLFIAMIALLSFLFYFFRYTVTGRRLLATGGNLQAARLSGINTDKMIVLANMLSGLFAALAALCWISRMGSAQPATGSNWMIVSFAVAVIGGTALAGGAISPIGLFFGGLIMVLIQNGLILIQVDVYFEQTFLGIIILLAVLFGQIRELFPAGVPLFSKAKK